MEAKYTEKTELMLSRCDSTKHLGIPDTFAVFMDIATKHAEMLKVSDREFGSKGLFWVVVRTKVHFNRRPDFMKEITVSTWPEIPGRVRCNRDYVIECDGEVAVTGKSEWAIIELATGRLQSAKDVYPDNIEFSEELALPEPYARFSESFEDAESFAQYRVRSTDIDFGGHMNNAAYIRALASLYTSEQWNALNITDIEINYKNQCYEGDVLTLRRKTVEGATYIGFFTEEKVIATVKIS